MLGEGQVHTLEKSNWKVATGVKSSMTLGPIILKNLHPQFKTVCNKLVLVPGNPFQLSLMSYSKARGKGK